MSTGVVIKYAELKSQLEEAGCYKIRNGKGDHEIWFNPNKINPETGKKGIPFTVPVPPKAGGTLVAIKKAAGLKKDAHDINAQRRAGQAIMEAAENRAKKWEKRISKSEWSVSERPSATSRRKMKWDYKLTVG